MDKIRQDILREQEMRKARLSAHFGKAFEVNETKKDKTNEIKKECGKGSLMKSIQIDSVDDALDIIQKGF